MTPIAGPERLDRTFAALANATRRSIVFRLAEGEATVNELAAPFAMKLPAISKHIKILEQAGLISSSRRAQFRICALNPEGLDAVTDWSKQCRAIWESRFDRMSEYLARIQAGTGKESTDE